MTVKLKDVEDIKKNLKSMEWDDLANNLIDLELEYEDIKTSLKEEQKESYNLLILLYEEEKITRLDKTFNHSKFMEDEHYVAYDWTDEIIDT
jgi:hypothetical protein